MNLQKNYLTEFLGVILDILHRLQHISAIDYETFFLETFVVDTGQGIHHFFIVYINGGVEPEIRQLSNFPYGS